MEVLILGSGVADVAVVEGLRDHPDFRKATVPMLLASDAVEKALATLPETLLATISDWGLVVGVGFGELEVTKDFLRTLTTRGIARPILFQNALHNAALGFLSLRLGIQGPGVTVSTHHFSGEDALSMAVDLLAAGDCAICLVVGVESIDAEMAPAVQAVYGGAGAPLSCGGALVLAHPEIARAFGLLPSLALGEILCLRTPGTSSGKALVDGGHGASALARLAAACALGQSLQLELEKPDGSHSRISVTDVDAC